MKLAQGNNRFGQSAQSSRPNPSFIISVVVAYMLSLRVFCIPVLFCMLLIANLFVFVTIRGMQKPITQPLHMNQNSVHTAKMLSKNVPISVLSF